MPSWHGARQLEVFTCHILQNRTPPTPSQLHLHHSTFSKISPSHSLGQSPCLLHSVQISVTSIPLNLSTCTKLHGVTSHRPSVYGITPFSACFINQNRIEIHSGLAALLSNFHPFISQCALRQVHSLLQCKFSTKCNLLLPLSISRTLSFP
jgi:hypothetical protein